MATYSVGSCSTDSAGFWKWECKKWCWCYGDDIGLVWVCVVGDCDDWTCGDDIEYTVVGRYGCVSQ